MALLICENSSTADEVPAFFLKIAKNIPRVGRSEGYDDFFKSRKNFPKLGNHDAQVVVIEINNSKLDLNFPLYFSSLNLGRNILSTNPFQDL